MPASATGLPIAAVERDTGLGKDTLRAWERRYGFPTPARDATGERVYPAEQVARLRLIKRLIDLGHRPGKLMQMSAEDLSRYEGPAPANGRPGPALDDNLLAYLDMCTVARAEELRHALAQALRHAGLRSFVQDVAGPLVRASGAYWEHGRFTVVEEHLLSDLLQGLLRSAINVLPRSEARTRPRILLTTFPQESHGLGLLMAEAIFTLEGAQCVSLGVQTPIDQIARAGCDVDIVALSFSTNLHSNRVRDGLMQLIASLPEHVEVWCGGSSPALRRFALPRVRPMTLESVPACLAVWREQHLLPTR